MTPPPSSQAQYVGLHVARTPTPTQSHLSSPPPTIRAPPPQSSFDPWPGLYTSEQLAKATMEELRSVISEISASYREARTTAAHQTLQYNLLRLESSEAMKRMQVELEMTQKEVEVLQTMQHRNAKGSTSTMVTPSSLNDQALNEMRSRCCMMEIEHEALLNRYRQARTLILEREATMMDEIERLRQRIRENRKHVNFLRQPNGLQDGATFSALETPQTVSTHQHRHIVSTPKARGDDTFAALLLADQVLSQEAATTPSTPILREAKRHQSGHARGFDSVTSLPSTPQQAGSIPANHPYYTQPRTLHPPSPLGSIMQTPSNHLRRRRESRDSTISADDLSTHEDAYSSDEDERRDEDVPESQASQEAVNILRKSSVRQAASTGTSLSPAAKTSGLLQSKLYGLVKKSGVERRAEGGGKRKFYDDASTGAERLTKKGKMSEGVGLGIGGWAGAGK